MSESNAKRVTLAQWRARASNLSAWKVLEGMADDAQDDRGLSARRWPGIDSPNTTKRTRAIFEADRHMRERTLLEVAREVRDAEHLLTCYPAGHPKHASILAMRDATRREWRGLLDSETLTIRLAALARALDEATSAAAATAAAIRAALRTDERDHLAGAPPGIAGRILTLAAAPGAPAQARVSLAAS